MKNILIVLTVVLVASGAVALGFFGVENAIARRPVQSSLDEAITAVSEAEPGLTEAEEHEETSVPQPVANYLHNNF